MLNWDDHLATLNPHSSDNNNKPKHGAYLFKRWTDEWFSGCKNTAAWRAEWRGGEGEEDMEEDRSARQRWIIYTKPGRFVCDLGLCHVTGSGFYCSVYHDIKWLPYFLSIYCKFIVSVCGQYTHSRHLAAIIIKKLRGRETIWKQPDVQFKW